MMKAPTLLLLACFGYSCPALPTTIPDSKCVVQSADIGFVVDASGSIGATEWQQSLEFASNVISAYDIGPNKVKVGMVGFSSTAYFVFDFNQYTSKAQVVAAIKNARKEDGGTATHLGLNMARNSLFQASAGMRPGVPSILFVITDGQSNSRADTFSSARQLHARNITVFAIGVQGANQDELFGIASKPEYVFNYRDFSMLSVIQQQFNKETCKVVIKLAPTTTPTTTTTTPTTTTTTPTTTTTTPTTTTTTPSCVVKSADVGFVIDASGSIDATEWQQSLEFAAKVVSEYDIGVDSVRVGLIAYSDTAYSIFDFNGHKTKSDVIAAIYGVYKDGGGTATHLALDKARDFLFRHAAGMRSHVPSILFVITDGESNSQPDTIASARSLHARGITVFAVGIQGADQYELRGIASRPEYVYNVQDFNKLKDIQDQFNTETCKVAVKATAPPCLCEDKEPDCPAYGVHLCYLQKYRKFATQRCPVFCGLCAAECLVIYPPPKPCVDKIPDCAKRSDVCTDLQLRQFALKNCPWHCSLCEEINPTRVIQTTTPLLKKTISTFRPKTGKPPISKTTVKPTMSDSTTSTVVQNITAAQTTTVQTTTMPPMNTSRPRATTVEIGTTVAETTEAETTEAETTEAETTEAETTEAETTVAETTEAETTVAETTEAETTEAETTEAETTEAETTVAETTDAVTTVAETTEAETTVAETTEAMTTEAETTVAETTEAETTEAETTVAETTEAETTEAMTTVAETTDAVTTVAETTETETTVAETTEAETTDAVTAEAETTVAETTEAMTTEAETTEAVTTEAETTVAETTEAVTTEAETTVAETTEAETTEATVAETTEAETTEAETTEAETTEAETTVAEPTEPGTTEAETTDAVTT